MRTIRVSMEPLVCLREQLRESRPPLTVIPTEHNDPQADRCAEWRGLMFAQVATEFVMEL